MILCGHPLPWVDTLTHLGTKVMNKIDGCQEDLRLKKATYLQKNCSIIQKLSYTHLKTKIKLNDIYNSHFSGSSLWDLFSPCMLSFESTFNRSVKLMADLPLETHRYFIEPLIGTQHMKLRILRNYLTFIKRIRTSSKPVLKQLYYFASSDVRSITGRNLRNILLLTNKLVIRDLEPEDIRSLKYNPTPENDRWRIPLLLDLQDIKHGILELPNDIQIDNLHDIMQMICKC